MIHNSPEEKIATEYFSQANGPVAFLLLSLGYTSLQFPHPEPFAWFSITMSVVWLFAAGGPYRSILKAYLPIGAPISRYIAIGWRLKIFIISMGFAVAIALGLNTDVIYSLLGYPRLDLK